MHTLAICNQHPQPATIIHCNFNIPTYNFYWQTRWHYLTFTSFYQHTIIIKIVSSLERPSILSFEFDQGGPITTTITRSPGTQHYHWYVYGVTLKVYICTVVRQSLSVHLYTGCLCAEVPLYYYFSIHHHVQALDSYWALIVAWQRNRCPQMLNIFIA